jgi:5-methylcytosine-specific restriction endonuclease McrA
MSPLMRICCETGCGRIFQPDPSRRRNDRCPEHAAAQTRRRDRQKAVKNKEQGRTTQHWRRLRVQALERDDYTCQGCGAPAVSVHISPALGGDHRAATLDDCVSACLVCHGRLDGQRGGYQTALNRRGAF